MLSEGCLSPLAGRIPEIVDGLMRALAEPLVFEWDQWPFPYELSNMGRRVLPEKRGGYTSDDLIDRESRKARCAGAKAVKRLTRKRSEYDQTAERLRLGGSPVGVVVLHSRNWPTNAFVVPPTWTPRRVVRVVGYSCRHCYWCGRTDAIDDYLMVTCGAFTRVFPSCAGCRHRFDLAVDHGPGLDWHVASDRWWVETGCCDDRYI